VSHDNPTRIGRHQRVNGQIYGQQWRLAPDISPEYHVVNKSSGWCLGFRTGGELFDRAIVTQCEPPEELKQDFELQGGADPDTTLFVTDGLCLDRLENGTFGRGSCTRYFESEWVYGV
jgi:hypothetical protein